MSLLGKKCENISKLYGFFADQRYFYMIMEYATDGELYKIVRNFKPHTRKHDYVEKLSLIRQVCKAVECMHQNNIMHRDVKPENILLNMVKILLILEQSSQSYRFWMVKHSIP